MNMHLNFYMNLVAAPDLKSSVQRGDFNMARISASMYVARISENRRTILRCKKKFMSKFMSNC